MVPLMSKWRVALQTRIFYHGYHGMSRVGASAPFSGFCSVEGVRIPERCSKADMDYRVEGVCESGKANFSTKCTKMERMSLYTCGSLCNGFTVLIGLNNVIRKAVRETCSNNFVFSDIRNNKVCEIPLCFIDGKVDWKRLWHYSLKRKKIHTYVALVTFYVIRPVKAIQCR
jgi:hypothetical protein